VRVQDVSLYVEDEGSGTPVVLLHGWPDTSQLWRNQIPVLAAAGYRVIAPDLRGFGRSDKPLGVDDYVEEKLIGDVLGLMDRLGLDRAHVVGHGWGAYLAWMLAIQTPERVGRLVVLGVPHPSAPTPQGVEEFEKTWWRYFYHFEGVAEAWLMHEDWKLFREFLYDEGDIDLYVEQLSAPGALTATLNWFRANMKPAPPAPPPKLPRLTAPVLGIWASGDDRRGLPEQRFLTSERFVGGPWHYERYDGVGHWVPLNAPDRFNASLLAWFGDANGG
jgi:pimeloyl-ACP methyl ester carboxylesterase